MITENSIAMTRLYGRVEAALNRLPSDAAGVAGFLVDRGITGVRDECSACPVSRWLRVELHVPVALVDIGEVTVVDDQGAMVHMNAVSGVAAFVAAFDLGGQYPDLVDHSGMTEQEAFSAAYL